MERLNLSLHIKAGNWRKYHQRIESANYQKIHEMIGTECEYRCIYCGYQSKKNQLVNKNFDYQDNTRKNIALACSLCLPIVLFDGFGQDRSFNGTVIVMPELRQVELNHFVRGLIASAEKNPHYQSRLNEMYLSFAERKDYVEKIFGKNSYDPKYFAQGLMDTFIDEKKLQHPILKYIRILPDRAALKNEVPDFVEAYLHVNV
ncbi:MAG: hypothetical protein FJ161_02865 [Gammaproteobacteria bacterium]|nr:hypothetical protein [Gammaproteobacteria bacterium]